MSVTIAIRDNETGETETTLVADGDYIVITTAPAYVGHINMYGNGTHVVTVKGRTRPSRASGHERRIGPRVVGAKAIRRWTSVMYSGVVMIAVWLSRTMTRFMPCSAAPGRWRRS
jgi:hypothetical protein